MRNALSILIPLLAPTLLYLLLKRGQGHSPAIAAKNAPWIWLAGGGVALAAAVLSIWGLSTGAPPTSDYRPAQFKDGKVVSGELAEPGEAAK